MSIHLHPGRKSSFCGLTRGLLNFFPIGIALVLIVHFGFTMAYLTPLNPIKLRVYDSIIAYMHPFFVQNWHLFAPDPVKDTRVLTVACRLRNPDGSTSVTAWADISTPLRQARYRNRFTPADRLDRPQSSAVHAIFNRDETLNTLLKRRTEEPSEYNTLVDELVEIDARERENGVLLLNRIASAHCDRLYGHGRTEAVQVRIVVLRFPRFSQRHLPDEAGELSYILLDWAPYEEVAPLVLAEVNR